MKSLTLITIVLSLTLQAKDVTGIISAYKNAKIVFLGKVIGIEEMETGLQNDQDCFQKKVIVEFEVEKIYKGKRFERLLIADTLELDYADYYIADREYVVYLHKVKRRKTGMKYAIARSRRFGDDGTVYENAEIIKYVQEQFFRKVKNPVPRIRIISGGCNC